MLIKHLFNVHLLLCLSSFLVNTHRVTQPNLPDACSKDYKAVFSIIIKEYPKDETVYMLVDDDDLWSYDPVNKKLELLSLHEEFQNIQSGVRGGTLSDDGFLWFFKGKTVWAYLNFALVEGFPKVIKDSKYPSDPESSINIGGKFYLIKENSVYEFDTNKLTIKSKSNLLSSLLNITSALTSDIKLKIDAVYNHAGQYFIFSKDKVHKLDRTLLQSLLNPKTRKEVWFPCFGTSPSTTKHSTRATSKPLTTTKYTRPTTNKSTRRTTTTQPIITTEDIVETSQAETTEIVTTETETSTKKVTTKKPTIPSKPTTMWTSKTRRRHTTTRPQMTTSTTRHSRPRTTTARTTETLETTEVLETTSDVPEITMKPSRSTLLTRPTYPSVLTSLTTKSTVTTRTPECHSKEKKKHSKEKHKHKKCSKEKKKHSKEKHKKP